MKTTNKESTRILELHRRALRRNFILVDATRNWTPDKDFSPKYYIADIQANIAITSVDKDFMTIDDVENYLNLLDARDSATNTPTAAPMDDDKDDEPPF